MGIPPSQLCSPPSRLCRPQSQPCPSTKFSENNRLLLRILPLTSESPTEDPGFVKDNHNILVKRLFKTALKSLQFYLVQSGNSIIVTVCLLKSIYEKSG